MKEIRLVIAVPSGQNWEAEFGMDLVFFTNYLASHGEVNEVPIQFRLHNKRGSILANMREDLIKQALAGGATHLLFIDSDQTFPPNIFHRLVAHKKKVVAVNVATKMLPPQPTARLADGVELYTEKDSTGLVKVWRVGTGIMLIDLNVFKREGMEQPWFNQHWNPKLDSYTGEDWAFCEKLEKAGVNIYVDQDVSREVGHVGKLNYGHDMIVASKMKEVV